MPALSLFPLIMIALSFLPLLVFGAAMIRWGIQERTKARRQLDWIEGMRERYPWLRPESE